MNSLLLLRGGQLAGLIGILLIVVSAVARLAGKFTFGGFATVTLMMAGIGYGARAWDLGAQLPSVK